MMGTCWLQHPPPLNQALHTDSLAFISAVISPSPASQASAGAHSTASLRSRSCESLLNLGGKIDKQHSCSYFSLRFLLQVMGRECITLCMHQSIYLSASMCVCNSCPHKYAYCALWHKGCLPFEQAHGGKQPVDQYSCNGLPWTIECWSHPAQDIVSDTNLLL